MNLPVASIKVPDAFALIHFRLNILELAKSEKTAPHVCRFDGASRAHDHKTEKWILRGQDFGKTRPTGSPAINRPARS
jgi:hypothetical protein